jgi:hypothetical protein
MKLNLLLLSAAALVNATIADDAVTPSVNLGHAGDYAILTKTGISTVPASSVTGDIAVSPIDSTAITGFELALDSDTGGTFSTDSSSQVKGTHKAYAADYFNPTPTTLTTAVSDMEAAYTDAAGRPNEDKARVNLQYGLLNGAEVLTPGIYTFDRDINISDDITLNGGADDVFIIQTTKNIVQSSNKKVILSGGAQAKNIFWQVAGEVDVGTGAHMEGVILSKTNVTFKTGSSLNGRVFSQTRCDLQMATIVEV